MIKKMLLVLLVLTAVGLSSLTINVDKPMTNCQFGVCEPVTITVSKQLWDHINEDLQLNIDNGLSSGYVLDIPSFQHGASGNHWFKGGFGFGSSNSVDIPFQLKAVGSGKYNISVVGVDTGTVYAELDPWWNSTFEYRTNFNLTSSSNTLTDFQVLVILNDSNINYSHTNDDGSDLRFTWLNQTSGDEQEISYWIDNQSEGGWNESGNSYVWIKAPQITTTGEQYYYYYGNTTAVNPKTNGNNVFLFFDDFEDNSFNTSKWSVKTGATPTETGGELQITGATVDKIQSINNFDTNVILEEEVDFNDGGTMGFGLSDMSTTSAVYSDDDFAGYYYGSGSTTQRNRNDGSQSDGSGFTDDTGYAKYGVYWLSGETRIYEDDVLKSSLTSNVPTGENLYIGASTGNDGQYIKYILLRKYSSDTITQSFGSEETAPITTVLNVTLNAPDDASVWNTSTSVQFNFTPVVENAEFSNCSLWTNESGAWALTQLNTSAIQNNTINSIVYDFGANTSIIWNVECVANDSTKAFATANYSLTINYTAPVTPPSSSGCPSANAPTDLSIYQTGATGSCCLDNHTVREFWTVGSTNYTKDVWSSGGCVNITGSSGLVVGVGSPDEWVKWLGLLVFAGIIGLIFIKI